MSVIEGSSYITEPDAALENVRGASKAKGKSAGHQQNAFAGARDSVSISASARNKHAAAVAGEDGEAAATAADGVTYKNETHALKAALRQLSEENGTPLRGWGLGHYRKAFRESEEGDLAAVRGIFNAKYGIQPAPVAEDPAVDPSIDPAEDGDPPLDDVAGDTGGAGDDLAGAVDDGDSEEGGLAASGDAAEDAETVAGISPGDIADPAAELLGAL